MFKRRNSTGNLRGDALSAATPGAAEASNLLSVESKLDKLSKDVVDFQQQLGSAQMLTNTLLREMDEKLAFLQRGHAELKSSLPPRLTPRSHWNSSVPGAVVSNTSPRKDLIPPQNNIKTILNSDRNEQRAMEAAPLLATDGAALWAHTNGSNQGRVGSKGRASSKDKLQEMLPNMDATTLEGLTFQEKLARAQEGLSRNKVRQTWLSKVVTEFLEDSESSPAAEFYSVSMTTFTLFAIIIGFLPAVHIVIPNPTRDILDIVIDTLLLAESVVRLMFYPTPSIFFTESWENVIDFMSALPLFAVLLQTGGKDPGWIDEFLLVAVPMIRLLRLVRRFPQIQLLKASFKDCMEALPALLYTMAIIAYAFTSLLFVYEPRSNLETISDCAWLVISTMTTVGFGDVVPVTEEGHLLTAILMLVSPMYMAIPFGIIGSSFTKIWSARHQIMLLQNTRARLAKWGFGPYEIPLLFQLFDLDESAEIDLEEFHLLLKEMEIGFRDDDIQELFKTIDKDSGGTIDEKEFVKTLYPNEYRQMYAHKRKNDAPER
eukprot:TRINITY_DN93083_c0_g1_i1.p1 TRINITY_DN93083_c0_g1~~TRINITY_DN93083_c0_g1_i1.p1  ORF type:complete len:558 (-),score=129.52 TRINITY_DN93083_c0_g1_i1:29-1663(-)